MNILLGEKIKKRRKELKLRQHELAGDDFTVSFISQIESGKMRPSLSSLEKISAKLGLSIPFLLSGESTQGTEELSGEVFVNITSYIMEIRTTILQSNFSSALDKLTNLRCELIKLTNDPLTMYCDFFRAKMLFELRRDKECLSILNHLVMQKAIQNSVDVFADVQYMLGTIISFNGAYKDALEHLLIAKETISSNKLSLNEIQRKCIVNLVSIYGERSDFIRTYELSSELLEYSKKNNYYEGVGVAILQTGTCLLESGDTEALKYLLRAAEFFGIAEDSSRLAHANFQLGNYYLRFNSLDLSIKHLDMAINVFSQSNNYRMLTLSLCKKALAFLQSGNPSKAFTSVRRANKVAKTNNLRPLLAHIYDVIGQILMHMHKYNWAISALLVAEKLYIEFASHNELAKLYSNLSELYMNISNIAKAKEALHKLNSVTK